MPHSPRPCRDIWDHEACPHWTTETCTSVPKAFPSARPTDSERPCLHFRPTVPTFLGEKPLPFLPGPRSDATAWMAMRLPTPVPAQAGPFSTHSSPWPSVERLAGGPSPSPGAAQSVLAPRRCESPARSAQQTGGEAEGCVLPTTRTPKAASRGNSRCPWRKVGRTSAHRAQAFSGPARVIRPNIQIEPNRAWREDHVSARCLIGKERRDKYVNGNLCRVYGLPP